MTTTQFIRSPKYNISSFDQWECMCFIIIIPSSIRPRDLVWFHFMSSVLLTTFLVPRVVCYNLFHAYSHIMRIMQHTERCQSISEKFITVLYVLHIVCDKMLLKYNENIHI